MLFPEEDAPLLKAWIVKRIENTYTTRCPPALCASMLMFCRRSDADSDVLAEYVIALLKHDGDQDAVRKLCEQEIPDFLTEDPKAFLDDVFQAIKYRSYVPGAPPPPKQPPAGLGSQSAQAVDAPAQGSSRKRAFDDQADSADAGERDNAYGLQRSYKQPRRGGRRGMDDNRGFPGMNMPAPLPAMPPAMPQFDPNNPMEAIMQMQAMGMPFPAMSNYPQQGFGGRNQRNQPRRRGRCRDFDTKGYCFRGSTCLYDHGNESIYVPPSASRGQEYEYDPNDAAMQMSTPPNQLNPFHFNGDVNRGRGGRRGRGNANRAGRKGRARAPFSAEGPVHDRSKSTIVIENIPEESFSEDEVRGFFSQFGNIAEVSMQPYKHLAIVKFDKWAAANNAYRSPKVIFDNRFVKVFWHKDHKDAPPASAPHNGANGSKFNGNSNSDMTEAEPEPEVDMDEFNRRQEEAQKQHQERENRKVELERRRQELQKQQQDLLTKHQEETERLRAKLSEKNGGDANGGSSGTDMLRAQLAALEHEAKILGIDPNAADDGSMASSRGGFRGGRGYRGRGGFTPRGRGSFRGQGARHAAYAQFSLDNRPKKLAVTGVDFTPADKDEVLRHFLLNLGEFESVETTPSVTHVSFQDRKTAEKFYYSLHGKELSGVEGKLDLAWVNSPLPPVAAKKPQEYSTMTSSEDAMAGMDYEQDASKDETERPQSQRQVDMDYEVGDDDAWGDGIQ
ncbi:Putative RNA-binding protein [Tolypocladium paradoxum]|uniref:RNA-binding protein n=1 Tax=Tolypocladium paradoxum TaxID=94208 RepID=A0A2S4LA77_9HYPO|nr:Putative RNA-binding protein [Tolypocladium paradoxum]